MTEQQASQYQIPTPPPGEVIATYNTTGEHSGEDAVRAALGEALDHAASAQPFEQAAVDQGRRESSVPMGAATISSMQYEATPVAPSARTDDFDPTRPDDLLHVGAHVIALRKAAQDARAA
jgi:hypothetical protein